MGIPQDLIEELEQYDLVQRESDKKWFMYHYRMLSKKTGTWLLCSDTIFNRNLPEDASGITRIREKEIINLQKRFY